MSEDHGTACRCPFCHGEHDTGQSFCTPCSVAIDHCPACNRPLPKAATTCPACGTPRAGSTERKAK